VQRLIQQGADVSAHDADNYTCLHLAATLPSNKIVQLLLKHGANTNATYSYFQQTPLRLAIQYGRLDNVRVFLQTLKQPSTANQSVDLTIIDGNEDSLLTFAQWLAKNENDPAHTTRQQIVVELQTAFDNCLIQAAKKWATVGADINVLKQFQPVLPHSKPHRKPKKNTWLVPACLSALGVLGVTATISSILIYAGIIILPFAPSIVTAIMLGMNILGMAILLGTIATTYYLRNKKEYEIIYLKEPFGSQQQQGPISPSPTTQNALPKSLSLSASAKDERQAILTHTPSPLASLPQARESGNKRKSTSSTVSSKKP
jgi:ankyrin repeat protein